VTASGPPEDLLRDLVPQVLGTLIDRYGQFSEAEDAVQEALLAAAQQWPHDGVPGNPRGWLVTVASRRLVDQWRSDDARRRREETVAAIAPAGQAEVPGTDDTLKLLLLCCHPALSAPSQVALTLRAAGGLSTAQIARAFLVPEATMAQRISRAKQAIKAAGATFTLPLPAEQAQRLRVVLQVLYLIFNEGYTTTSGPQLIDTGLTGEAIRLTRTLRQILPHDGEVTGLLALMLLTDARRATRTAGDGGLIPLSEQDRSRWDQRSIAEGISLVSGTLSHGPLGPYQLQAAIAAVHAEAPTAQETDWPQILALYSLLERMAPNPMVRLNHAVALAMVKGPQAGLDLLSTLEEALSGQHRLDAVRAHLLELAGDMPAAKASYQRAARRTRSLPEQRYLTGRAARIAAG
jgi:RNA polymerase sigma factor (sigma-70 family)